MDGMGRRALRIAGWAWDYKHEEPPQQIIATSDGIISGLAAVGDWRPAIKVDNPGVKSSYVGYVGYVRDLSPYTAMKIYALLRGKPTLSLLYSKRHGLRILTWSSAYESDGDNDSCSN